jgi:3D (Asp-Asp-Asp) domain-containing protein
MKPLYSGSAAIAATILASSLFLSAKPSTAETLLSSFQKPKQELIQGNQQDPQPDQKRPSVASNAEATTESANNGAARSPVEGEVKPGIAAKKSAGTTGVVTLATDPAGALANGSGWSAQPAMAATTYTATAYSLGGRTANGMRVSKGLIAADPRVLPLGTRVRLEAGAYSGEYLVADTGGAVRGKKIDIWTPNNREAFRFGRRLVKLTVLSYPAKRALAPLKRKK